MTYYCPALKEIMTLFGTNFENHLKILIWTLQKFWTVSLGEHTPKSNALVAHGVGGELSGCHASDASPVACLRKNPRTLHIK